MAQGGGFLMPLVKICGNTNPEDAKLAVKLGADYLGLIFTESKRRVDVATAKQIMAALPGFQNFVGVFHNQPKQDVEFIARELGLRYLQFHGDETALYCEHFKENSFEVIKTFHIKDAMSLKRIDEYDVFAFLLDTYSKDSAGGTGKTFDWNLLGHRSFFHDRLFLAGGLNVNNLEAAIRQIQPYAVDVASGVEKEPGKKDPALLEEFIRIAKRGTLNAEKSAVSH
jgi:phosphoribosylanthranilate isomerase